MENSRIGHSTLVIAGIAVTALGAYALNFWLWPDWKLPLSKESGTWGEFGDYMGGILNPLVAFGALIWLVESVRTQKQELAATRQALADQAGTSLIAARIEALNIELFTVVSRHNHLRARELFIVEHQNARDNPRSYRDAAGIIQDLEVTRQLLNSSIIGTQEEEDRLLSEVKALTSRLK